MEKIKKVVFSIENENFANFAKHQNLSVVSVKVAGSNIGLPGWAEHMQEFLSGEDAY